jgi:hypothetical protein
MDRTAAVVVEDFKKADSMVVVGGAVDERMWRWVGLGDACVSHGCIGVVLGQDFK